MKKFVKVTSAILACASITVLSYVPALAAKYAFTDISDDKYDWCAPQIQEMYTKGLITGYDNNTYRPDNEVTRQECLSLFARAMGSSDKTNEPVLAIAHELYDDTINTYSLTWGTDEIVYLLYRGALDKADLNTYLKGDEKTKPMKRYEAAMIITKAMGGTAEAESNKNASLSYADASRIPATAVGYVKYAMDKEIMTGMEDNKFSPLTSVSRSQIAVMLKRAVDKTNYTFEAAKLVSVDTDAKTCTFKDNNGNTAEKEYDDNTVMNSLGVKVIPSNMITDVSVIATYSDGKLAYVDALSAEPDKTIIGKYVGYGNKNGAITLRVIPTGASEETVYTCAKDVSFVYDGKASNVRNLAKDDTVEMTVVNGVVESVAVTKGDTVISGAVVTDISISPKLTVTISHSDSAYDGKTYEVSNSVIVTKNGASADFSNIYIGDTVKLTLRYGEIQKVAATAKSSVVTGTIKSLTIATQPSMVVTIDGKDKEYMITNDIKITINGTAGTLYDFRVGDSVTLNVESDAVKAITAKSTQNTTGSASGTVKAVNASYGFITIEGTDGSGETTVFCKDTKTTFITSAGKTLKMSNVKVGDVVDIRGTVSNGAFEATLVIVTQ